MKTILLSLLSLLLTFGPAAASSPRTDSVGAQIEIVITPKRILLVTDELPMKSLVVRVFDSSNHIVIQKEFSSKTTDWSFDVSHLPGGSYTVQVGAQTPVAFVQSATAFRANL